MVLQLVALRFLRKLEKCGFCAFYDADGTLFYAPPTWLKYLNEAWGTDYKPEDVISTQICQARWNGNHARGGRSVGKDL